LQRFAGIGAVTAVDISSGMHRRAIARLHAHRAMIGRLQHQLRQRRRDRGHAEGAGLEVEFSKYFFGCATGIAGRKVGSPPEAGD